MVDYEKIAEEVPGLPGVPPNPLLNPGPSSSSETFDASTVFEDPRPADPFSDPAAAQARANKVYLPLNHDKYLGIAESKGYAQGDDYSGNRLKRVHYSHEAMIDVIIAEPTITQNDLAKRFDRSVSWVSIVIGSDSFQAALAKRRDDILDPFLIATIEERFRGLATQSLTVISDALEKTKNLDVALKALDISSKALGFGARAANPTAVQNNFVVQLPPQIADSSEWAKAHSKAPIIEGNLQ